MDIKARVRIDPRTKNLAKRIKPGEIAVINHVDLDQVAADSLVKAKVKMVINAATSISGRYPNPGPTVLLDASIPLLDNIGVNTFAKIREGDILEIRENEIWRGSEFLGSGEFLELKAVQSRLHEIRKDLSSELDKFLLNTLEYAVKEKGIILGDLKVPEVDTQMDGKPVLVVVRGHHYRQDLTIVKSYIDDVNPVLIGVDGGADALLEFGYKPDIIVGDMDSVSERALQSGAELVVHAYPDGRAPGMAYVAELGLPAKIFPAPGTSEDIALLMAYEKGADLIVAVGTHFSMVDFLEKGRKGMGSTFLVRLKVGSILVDAKGLSRIYQGRVKLRYLVQVSLAGIIAIGAVLSQIQWSKDIFRTFWLQLKILLGL